MKRNKILFGMIISTLSMLLISINPVVGYVTINNNIEESIAQTLQPIENDDSIQYISIPSEFYKELKEYIFDIEDNDLRESFEEIINEWDYYGYTDGVKIYIPILCEFVTFILVIFFFYQFMLNSKGIHTPVAETVVYYLLWVCSVICK